MTEAATPARRPSVRALRAWPWYPMLLAATSVLNLFADFPLQPAAGVRALLIAFVVGFLATIVWLPVFGRDRAGVAAIVTLAAVAGADDPVRLALCVAALLVLFIEARWVRRGTMQLRIPWPRVTGAINVLVVVLVAMQLGRAVYLRVQLTPLPMPAEWSADATGPRPDVFLILVDGHGRRDVLQRAYGYDMAALQGTLQGLGFAESPDSHANHSVTKYSLSVLLNGRPVAELGQDLAQPADGILPFRALAPSGGVRLFDGAGYETVVISSGYDHLPLREVDRYIDVGPRTEIEQSLLGTLALGRFFDSVTSGDVAATRDRMLRELDALRELARTPSEQPQFVLAHLPSPHLPFVFEADCSLRPRDAYTAGEVGRGEHAGDATAITVTADQTRCVDGLVSETVADLVAARPDAVVIVFSDHGPEERLDWTAPAEPGISERLANLFYARTPGRTGVFPADVTLVNVLPLIANNYLGTSIPVHPADLYLGPTPADPHFLPYHPPDSRLDLGGEASPDAGWAILRG